MPETVTDKTVVNMFPKQESSVEISTNSRGDAQLCVKVYSEMPEEALVECLRLYAMGQTQLKELKEANHAQTK